MSEYMTVAYCAKCGKEFLPAPNHAYKKNKLQYCSWSCFSHRNDKPKSKVEVFYGVDSYNAVKPVMYEIIKDLEAKGIEIMRCSVRGMYFETKNIIIRIIPRSKNIEGLECDEVFGWIVSDKAALYLRKYPDIPIYDGTIVDYILEKEGTVDGQVSNM